jgi:phosphonate transport system substrate-binding protein
LANLTGRLPKKTGTRIAFGAYTHTTPSDMFTRFAPLLSYLETNVPEISLRVDFYIYRGYSNAVEALASGQVGIMRPGPGSYVSARQGNPSLRVLAKQLHAGQPIIHGVIFTRSDSGIIEPRDVVGKKVASADEESTFGNYAPKAFLFELGIRRRNLAGWTYVRAHDETVRQVANGSFHVGAANSNVVARFIREGAPLRILHSMQSVSFPWVGSTNLGERAVQAIQRSLLSLKDPWILSQIDENLDGLTTARPEDYDEFEHEVVRKARAFEE